MYMIASASVIGIPAMFGDKGIANVIVGLLTMVIAFASSFLATRILSKTNVKGPKINAPKQDQE